MLIYVQNCQFIFANVEIGPPSLKSCNTLISSVLSGYLRYPPANCFFGLGLHKDKLNPSWMFGNTRRDAIFIKGVVKCLYR